MYTKQATGPVSEAQAAANRRNARKSTGPKTEKGKQRVSRNALKHGILSGLKVLPGIETEQEWERHLAQTRGDLKPNGYVARALVDMIALDLWQQKRAARYQMDLTSQALEKVEADVEADIMAKTPAPVMAGCEGQPYVERVKSELLDILEFGAVVGDLSDLPDEERLRDGMMIVHLACLDARVDFKRLRDLRNVGIDPSEFPDANDLADIPWTAALVRRALRRVAESRNIELAVLMLNITARIGNTVGEHFQKLIAFHLAVQESRCRRTLPKDGDLERICRYRAHSQRSISRRLEQLARLQKARRA